MIYGGAIAAAAVFFVLIFPLPLRLQVYLNHAQNRVYYSVILFHAIYLYSGYLYYGDGRLMATSFLGKKKLVDLSKITKSNMPFPSIFRYGTFTKLNLFFEVGKNGDAFFPVMASGFLRALLGSISAVIREKNKVIDLNHYVVTKTDRDTLEMSVDSTFRVSILGILYSVAKDLMRAAKKRKEKKEKHA